MDSPPKRVTRARAAAKASEAAIKSTKSTTTTAKARSLLKATANTQSTAAKRKTRADDTDEGGNAVEEPVARKTTRARPRRALDKEENNIATDVSSSSSNTAVFRRSVRKPNLESSNDNTTGSSRLRGRPRKVPLPATELRTNVSTRTRAGTESRIIQKEDGVVTKKAVKFQESGKENLSLASKSKGASSSTGALTSRPARRKAAAVPKSWSRAPSKSPDNDFKKPLSPRKVTQMPVSRDKESSEDELAGGDEMGPFMKSPLKPSINPPTDRKSPQVTSDQRQDNVMTDATELAAAPATTALASPPRRPPTSPVKESLLSPAKRPGCRAQLPGSLLTSRALSSGEEHHQPSLLRSPAKRPPSPMKGSLFPSMTAGTPLHGQPSLRSSLFQSPAKRAMPGVRPLANVGYGRDSPVAKTPQMQPIVATTSNISTSSGFPSQLLLAGEAHSEQAESMGDDTFTGRISGPKFPGRMSAVLPRHADPLLSGEDTEDEGHGGQFYLMGCPASEEVARAESFPDAGNDRSAAQVLETTETSEECVTVFGKQAGENKSPDESWKTEAQTNDTVCTAAPATKRGKVLQLRGSTLDPCQDLASDFESEDDLSPLKQLPAQKNRLGGRCTNARDSIHATRRDSRRSTFGFTSLTEKFGAWVPASPTKGATGGSVFAEGVHDGSIVVSTEIPEAIVGCGTSPMKSTYFEDEILVHADVKSACQNAQSEVEQRTSDDAVTMDDITMTKEDIALAAEASNMSLMPQYLDDSFERQHGDDALSEASQEYGDENQLPEDPALLARRLFAPSTPTRSIQRQKVFSTTTKVPLKPADDSEPSPSKKQSNGQSVANLSRSATVISYSPTKGKKHAPMLPADDALCTPARGDSDSWSSSGTPAKTPRRCANPELLRGAVVFVDVHTTEGADASGIFVELLSQMGARCVKTWHWSPNSSANGESLSSNKVGITHVVFKDGGKRTMEKVRETLGVVHCVGVSWVLDCERENEWLEESRYYIDTAVIPRGGAKRRKSMEPKAIANLNGTIVSGSGKPMSSKPPHTPRNRRASTLWMHTPSDQGSQDDEDLEWSCALLTPVPKTPAPEAIAKYAAELPETPYTQDSSSTASPLKEQYILTRTCPPKESKYGKLGEGILSQEKDERVMMRLMAARRKSLQFAPKIGSPLARTWG
ncbi:brct domain containing protein [Metarhizium rileyi]|uniref:Brct domain containing protein n=1 Tax=Metarhizium rileyi (strain RCEF 4871) TaxID=1649241 RepID=A0A166VVX6_METRR|nr:brct domain containing protein [Metarhizium rileyi RCEF 4871]